MARDLIPPPSPAGRPSPDQPSPLAAQTPPASEPPAPAPPEVGAVPAPFRGRFGFVLGTLIGTGIAASLALAVLLTSSGRDSDGLARDWSRWEPTSRSAEAGAAEIAEHVGRHYRLRNGHQLVAVTGGPLAIQDVPLSIALRPEDGHIEVVEGRGVLYTLNGLGPRGSIREGKPSEQRHLLLRREALELALYSFRYLEDVNMVVTLLPPPPPGSEATTKDGNGGGGSGKKGQGSQSASTLEQPQTQAIFYRPGDLKPQLQVPLGATMSPTTPKPDDYDGEEARRIDTLTISNLFLASVQQAQDTKAYLVLDRPS